MSHRPGPDRAGRAPRGAVRHRGPGLRRASAGGRAGQRGLPRARLRRAAEGGGRAQRRALAREGRDRRPAPGGGQGRALQRDHRHAPPGGARRDLDLRPDAALQVQGPGRQLHRRRHRGGEAHAPPRAGDHPREHDLSRDHARDPAAGAREHRTHGGRRLLPRLQPRARRSGQSRRTAPGTRPRWSAASPTTAAGWPWRSTSPPSTPSCRCRPPRRPSW